MYENLSMKLAMLYLGKERPYHKSFICG